MNSLNQLLNPQTGLSILDWIAITIITLVLMVYMMFWIKSACRGQQNNGLRNYGNLNEQEDGPFKY